MVSLVFKRRRVWFRLRPCRRPRGRRTRRRAGPVRAGTADRTVVEVGGLARTDQAGYGEEFATLADASASRETVTVPPMAGRLVSAEWVRQMNETWAHISDLAFEAALAGYVVALVCYAIEFAARRGGDVPADQRSARPRAG